MADFPSPLPQIRGLSPYEPGLSIAEIGEKYGLTKIIKLASNENPLGASPLVQEAISRMASSAFRYPQGGNPRLVKALARWHNVPEDRIVAGNGSDEIIDLLIRMLAMPGEDNIACFLPCFSLYPLQARIANVEIRRQPLKRDFSFDFDGLLDLVDNKTRIVFVTTPDNPSGLCPSIQEMREFARHLENINPGCLLMIDEAYMDFAPDEMERSLLANGYLADNIAYLRTFSKSFGLAGMRVGYGILPPSLADAFWRARLPFSINILAEEAALAALDDLAFREKTMQTVKAGREQLQTGLAKLGCETTDSKANFVMFKLPDSAPPDIFTSLLKRGIIIRQLKSYGLPSHFRVTVGTPEENKIFLSALASLLQANQTNDAK